jgi:glycosyltransferase involved in cell wall biosynthesis
MKNILTIVIPCKNEEDYIYRTLYKLNEQKGICGVNVFIADGGSTDSTLIKIDRFESVYSNLKINIIEGGSVSFGRNNGARFSFTKYILFLDADTLVLSKDAILESVTQMETYNFHLSTCKVKSTSPTLISKFIFWIFNKIQRWMPETFCTGQFFLIKKDIFDLHGGFDESIHQSEDYLLSRNIPKNKFNIVNRWIGQDDRRFKKMGYFNFILLILKNYFNRNNKEYFTKDIGYWK